MNWLVIGGITFLGIGALLISPLIEPDWSVIVGVSVQVVGYFAIRKGVSDSSKTTIQNSEKNVIKEINEFRKELQIAKHEEKPSKEIAKIEDRFERWADEFETNKSLQVLEINQEKLEKKKHDELLNKRWNKTFHKIFQILEYYFNAYSKRPKSSISEVDFPIFPSKLVSKEAAHYFCKVSFKNKIFLYISLYIVHPDGKNILPNINFTFDKEDKKIGKSLYSGELFFYSDLELILNLDSEEEIIISKMKNGSRLDSDRTTYPMPKSEDEWESRLQEVVEYIIAKAEADY